jgi:hypothetical protein
MSADMPAPALGMPPGRDTFLALDDSAVAAQLQQAGEPVWAVAMGATRRAYIAQGGVLASSADLQAYVRWAEAAQRAVMGHVYDLGVRTLIAAMRIAPDRGGPYRAVVAQGLRSLIDSVERRAFYQQRGLHVGFAGNLEAIGEALDDRTFAEQASQVGREDPAGRARLIYLLRGPWDAPGTDEAQLGYQLGQKLGRAPTRAELVEAFYSHPVGWLRVYVGSGRPLLGLLRPPFISATEDCYWSQAPLPRLRQADWRRIAYDHIWERRTAGARAYPADAQGRAALRGAIESYDGVILGVGTRHQLGFWQAEQS